MNNSEYDYVFRYGKFHMYKINDMKYDVFIKNENATKKICSCSEYVLARSICLALHSALSEESIQEIII